MKGNMRGAKMEPIDEQKTKTSENQSSALFA
jgi:hypothetical protein